MRKFFFGATATRAFSSATAKRSTLGIGIIVCLTAFFAFGLKTGVSGPDATAQRQTKVDAKSANTSAKIAPTTAKPATLATTQGTKPANHAAVVQQYVKLPLSFEPNLGQANGDAKFLARGDGYSLFLTSNEAVLAMAGHSTKSAQPAAKPVKSTGVLRMELLGSNPAPNFSAQDELPGKSNYFIGDQENWRSNVPNYAKVAEKNVYPGIDLVYYGTQRQLEYDFNVAPGADPKAIQISFEGARKLRVDAAGNLILGLAGGEVKFEKPFAYQMKGDEKEPVAARFHLGDRKYRVYFAIDNYDATRPLVIDPILSYSTYLGGSGIDVAHAIAVAPDDTAFIAGGTDSLDFPTAHPLQPNDGGSFDFPKDAFVTKISADGSTLLYSTYLGGKNEDFAQGIAVDAAGEAFVAGTTLSSDFPVTPGSFNPLCGGDGKCGATFNSTARIVSNGFVTKINAAGSAIIYSGFIGAFENVSGNAIAVDANENAYITGSVPPNDFASAASGGTPVVLNILASPNGAISNGDGTSTIFVTSNVVLPINQLVAIAGVGGTTANPNPPSPFDGSFIVLSSTPGSFKIPAAGGPADGNGTVTVNTAPPFPITPTAFQPHFDGGSTDAYVIKINSTGSGILYSSYLGGDSEDVGNAIAVDTNNDAYITGLTDSSDFPVKNASQPIYGGNGDAFFAELNTASSGTTSLVYSTFLGGSGLDQGNGIAVALTSACTMPMSTVACNAYIAGGTGSRGLGGTVDPVPVDCALAGTETCEGDAFVAEFNPNLSGIASRVVFTYLGGSLADSASGVALDQTANIYVTGSTVSPNFPVVGAAFQTSFGGGNDDAFVAKIDVNTLTLDYSSYLGGTNTDNGNGIAVDTAGRCVRGRVRLARRISLFRMRSKLPPAGIATLLCPRSAS